MNKKKILHSNMVRFIICLILFLVNRIGKLLHSNMVRFIIKKIKTKSYSVSNFYIPIWLDLLSRVQILTAEEILKFTFQYG